MRLEPLGFKHVMDCCSEHQQVPHGQARDLPHAIDTQEREEKRDSAEALDLDKASAQRENCEELGGRN